MNLENCKNFSEVARYQSVARPDKIFIRDLRSGRDYTFKQFNEIVDKVAAFLVAKAVVPGDRITVVIQNSPEYCFLYFASLRTGAIFNPLPFSSHKEEIMKNVSYVRPKVVFIDSRRALEFELENEKFINVPVLENRVFEAKINKFNGHLGKFPEFYENEPACLYYSSGTTGNPKGVLFSHKNMISNISSICRSFGFMNERETHLVFLPLGHTASINYSFLPCMYAGGKMVLAESFWQIKDRLWGIIQKEKATYMEAVPTILYALLNIYQEPINQNLSSMRFVGCGSAPLQKSVQTEFQRRTGLKVANLYGLSETGPTHIDNPLQEGWQPGSIGIPMDVNEVAIVDENDNKLPPYERGEIVIRGPNVFVGYYQNDKLYDEVMRGGWFHTGDLGYQDKEGRYFYVDRIKDLIIKGGANVVPNEIDEILLLHPAIKECVTIGIPDEMFGEEIKSFVVFKDNFLANSEELKEHCKKYLANLKVPKEIEIVESIPKTHSGKLLRKNLRK